LRPRSTRSSGVRPRRRRTAGRAGGGGEGRR
jgi:hypothetical protein